VIKIKKEHPMSPMKIMPIKNPLDKLPEILKRNLDQNLCTCNDVPKMDVIHAIANGARTVEEVKNITLATDGIGCCNRFC